MLKKLTTIVTIAAVSSLLPLQAFADSIPSETSTTVDTESIIPYYQNSEKATFYLISGPNEAPKTIKVGEDSEIFEDFFESNSLNIQSWKMADGSDIDPNRLISEGGTYVLKKVEYQGTITQIEINYPTVEEDDYTIPLGQKIVVQEGIKGSALLTSITNSDNQTVDSVSVISSPVEEIVAVGAGTISSITQGAQYTGSDTSWGKTSENLKEAILEMNPDNKLIETLVDQVGKNYVWGATGPDSFDCSGLVLWSFTKNGYKNLPRVANAQGHYSIPVSPQDIQPGDILWTPTHIATYVGGGLVIHAADSQWGVVITNLDWFLKNGFQIGRFPHENSENF